MSVFTCINAQKQVTSYTTNFYLKGLDDPWFSQLKQDMFLSSKISRMAQVPTQPLLNGYNRLLPLGYSTGRTELTTNLHLMSSWANRAIHLPCYRPSWWGQLYLSPLLYWRYTHTARHIPYKLIFWPILTLLFNMPVHFSSSILKPGIVSSTNFASRLMKPMKRVTKLWPGNRHKQMA
jgi:hypothetical protein